MPLLPALLKKIIDRCRFRDFGNGVKWVALWLRYK
jgi:hypothetical protein